MHGECIGNVEICMRVFMPCEVPLLASSSSEGSLSLTQTVAVAPATPSPPTPLLPSLSSQARAPNLHGRGRKGGHEPNASSIQAADVMPVPTVGELWRGLEDDGSPFSPLSSSLSFQDE
ncbi:hypothetical protein AOLI_G00184050 [Acnodon oligacanthus]